ncbi:bis-aminopropyl spermidine synthase family protein [Bacillus cereus]|uniref:bis-aminopropyl spermidine synthase family protein n=1 Tax=Bacillus cereus TaxID=1396 RepID=UPI00065B512D|nr:bis-aminopropyl spermidine synthase family protein [Bacillus cereus]KMQ32164.1 hypothetical protein TU58_01370 [Bacillus cereus]
MEVIKKTNLKSYVNELKLLIPQDNHITLANVESIMKNISNNVNVETLFHSKMMFFSIFLLVRKLYIEKLISFYKENGKNKIAFNNTEVDYESESGSLHIVSCEAENEKIIKGEAIISARPFEASLEYYQSFDTFDSLKRRLKIMSVFDDMEDKDVIFLGDDELFSVLFALHSKAKRIVVVDIDDRILEHIQEINKEYNLTIETYKCDVLQPLPKELELNFDVFFASGLKHFGGLLAFICSGLTTLKNESEGAGYFSFYEYNKQESSNDEVPFEFKLQEQLIKLNCFVDCIVPCDEIEIPEEIIQRTLTLITGDIGEELTEDYLDFVKSELRKDNPLSADPSFPLFPVKPIKLARIKTNGIKTGLPKRLLKIIKHFK